MILFLVWFVTLRILDDRMSYNVSNCSYCAAELVIAVDKLGSSSAALLCSAKAALYTHHHHSFD